MIDFQTNVEQIEEIKTAALIIGFSVIACLAIFAGAVVLITRWWLS
jgi:hypothetical protein